MLERGQRSLADRGFPLRLGLDRGLAHQRKRRVSSHRLLAHFGENVVGVTNDLQAAVAKVGVEVRVVGRHRAQLGRGDDDLASRGAAALQPEPGFLVLDGVEVGLLVDEIALGIAVGLEHAGVVGVIRDASPAKLGFSAVFLGGEIRLGVALGGVGGLTPSRLRLRGEGVSARAGVGRGLSDRGGRGRGSALDRGTDRAAAGPGAGPAKAERGGRVGGSLGGAGRACEGCVEDGWRRGDDGGPRTRARNHAGDDGLSGAGSVHKHPAAGAALLLVGGATLGSVLEGRRLAVLVQQEAGAAARRLGDLAAGVHAGHGLAGGLIHVLRAKLLTEQVERAVSASDTDVLLARAADQVGLGSADSLLARHARQTLAENVVITGIGGGTVTRGHGRR